MVHHVATNEEYVEDPGVPEDVDSPCQGLVDPAKCTSFTPLPNLCDRIGWETEVWHKSQSKDDMNQKSSRPLLVSQLHNISRHIWKQFSNKYLLFKCGEIGISGRGYHII